MAPCASESPPDRERLNVTDITSKLKRSFCVGSQAAGAPGSCRLQRQKAGAGPGVMEPARAPGPHAGAGATGECSEQCRWLQNTSRDPPLHGRLTNSVMRTEVFMLCHIYSDHRLSLRVSVILINSRNKGRQIFEGPFYYSNWKLQKLMSEMFSCEQNRFDVELLCL